MSGLAGEESGREAGNRSGMGRRFMETAPYPRSLMESGNLFGSRFRVVLVLVAEFISIKKSVHVQFYKGSYYPKKY